MSIKTITLAEVKRELNSGKPKIVNFLNKQTGLIYSYKIEQASYDPIDPDSSAMPPKFIFSQIGDGEWVYMGALYRGIDYNHYEESVFPNDYPCVKVFRFALKCIITGAEPAHIEASLGEIMTTDEGNNEKPLNCEQVSNLQYGKVDLREGIIAGEVSKELANNFINKKNYHQMHSFFKKQIA